MMKMTFSMLVSLMIAGCSSSNNNPKAFNALPDILQVGQSILSADTVMHVVYPAVNDEQRDELARLTSLDVPDSTQLIGTRPLPNGFSLEAYKAPTGENPNMFKVFLVTRDRNNTVTDAIDLREFHTSEHQKPMRLGGNRFYTTDATLHFHDGNRFTLHRVMTLTSLYLKDHRLTEAWRVEWDNHYEIASDGHILFKGQHETLRTPADLDDPVINDYQARDL